MHLAIARCCSGPVNTFSPVSTYRNSAMCPLNTSRHKAPPTLSLPRGR
jgi:hypothetical protein